MKRGALVLAVLATVWSGGGMGAQEVAPLQRVEDLTSMGKTDDARALLLSWWDSTGSSASRSDRQRALWLRGRLIVDPIQAELDFRRLTIEFPGGPYSGRALFRLAQSAFAAGDADAARQRVAGLVRSYPGSRVSREAEDWLAQVGDPPPPLQLPPSDTTSRPAVRPSTTPAAPTESAAANRQGSYAVQLGAFSGTSRAQTLATRAREAGLRVRVVRVEGSRLVRVRVGRFTSPEPANELLKRVKDLGFQAALVRDADQEEEGR